MLQHLPASSRGRTRISWLDSAHSFSFGEFYKPDQMGFRALRVVNDDRVAAGGGFGTHGHKDMEIISYDVSGAQPRLVKRIPTGDGAHAFRAKGDKRHVFVSNRVANTISLIDSQTLTVVGEYPGPGGPDCMEMLSDGRTLLVSSRWARKLSFIDTETKKVTQQVDVGKSPHGVWTLDHAARQ